MQKCYLISYDLNKGSRIDYEELYKEIKGYGTWAHINESLWAIVTDSSAKEIREGLNQYLDNKDVIFVVKSGTEAARTTNVICRSERLKNNL